MLSQVVHGGVSSSGAIDEDQWTLVLLVILAGTALTAFIYTRAEHLGVSNPGWQDVDLHRSHSRKGFRSAAQQVQRSCATGLHSVEVRQALTLGRKIGKGAFGEVFEGTYNGERVAVKLLRPTSAQLRSVFSELHLQASLQHESLVRVKKYIFRLLAEEQAPASVLTTVDTVNVVQANNVQQQGETGQCESTAVLDDFSFSIDAQKGDALASGGGRQFMVDFFEGTAAPGSGPGGMRGPPMAAPCTGNCGNHNHHNHLLCAGGGIPQDRSAPESTNAGAVAPVKTQKFDYSNSDTLSGPPESGHSHLFGGLGNGGSKRPFPGQSQQLRNQVAGTSTDRALGSGATVLPSRSPCMEAMVLMEYCSRGSLAELCKGWEGVWRDQQQQQQQQQQQRPEEGSSGSPHAGGGGSGSSVTFIPSPQQQELLWLLLRDVAAGIAYLHDNNMLHGDLKAHNVLLVEKPGRPYLGLAAKVADFGLAFMATTSGGSTTNVGVRGGTVTHMPPEVFDEAYDVVVPQASKFKRDVYAFGILMLEVMLCYNPYRAIAPVAVMQLVQRGKRPSLPEWMPAPVSQLIIDCWQQHPDDRPSMAQVLARVQAIELGPGRIAQG